LEDIERQSKEINVLEQQLSCKQKDVVSLQSEVERYKIQINSLNQKLSDIQIEMMQSKDAQILNSNDTDVKKMQQTLDFQKNLNNIQKLTIEKLESKILVLESA
jgi:chromosome segregation ATPase